MDGQLDALALLDDLVVGPPVPALTVYTCVWSNPQRCGWCDGGNISGGGAQRNPANEDESIFYDYCHKCSDKYGSPRIWDPAFRLNINRTQTPRPAHLGPRVTKEDIP